MPSTLRDRVVDGTRTLAPGYFALVMASGIISVGLHLERMYALSVALLVIALVGYVLLAVLNVVRATRYGRAMLADFVDPARAFTFFTFVAASEVIGTRLAADGYTKVTGVLLGIGGTAWVLLGYVVPWTAVLGHKSRPVVAHANGTWFIWVVGSESVAVASATLEPVYAAATNWLAVVAVVSWSVGVFLYGAAGIFVSLRMLLYPLDAKDLNPPYWVSMGACAITVLAGARIVEMADAPMVNATRGLIAGLAVVFWAFGTWLIPVLVVASVWRHTRHRVPLRYEATHWSMVFPMGMYAVAGIYLGEADHLPVVGAIGRIALWVALVVFAVVFVAMVRHVVLTVLTGRAAAGPAS